jgi:tetratricopeptide (TPR) repeat protein
MMPGHVFISYSRADASDFALRLCDELQAGPPTIPTWLDRRRLIPSRDWDSSVAEAIRVCVALLFVMTRDSVEDGSTCKQEWTLALSYKKPIVPLLLHRDARLPFRLNTRDYVDFNGDFETALAQLRKGLLCLLSPAGVLQSLRDRLADAKRDLRRAADPDRGRIEDEIAALAQQIAEQACAVADPQAAAERTQHSIERAIEHERERAKPVSDIARPKFINQPPAVAPNYFQDRYVETRLVADFLNDESRRILTVVGRAGIGKTAMACRLLKALETGDLPNDLGKMTVDGILYLSPLGVHPLNGVNLFVGLCKLLPDHVSSQLDLLYRNPRVSTGAKMYSLLDAFQSERVVVLLDNFEAVLDAETTNIRDTDLKDALYAILDAPRHRIKTILTTRILPRDLVLFQPGRQVHLALDKGLECPHAETILREMDADGRVGLRTAPDDLLARAREYTRGFPRALEALFAILSVDRYTTLSETLDNATPPNNVVDALVGEAFNRLDANAQRTMQALSVYNRPVAPAAVDYVMQPFLPSVNSAPVLNRLVNMQFARCEGGRYYLHPADRAYAFGRLDSSRSCDSDQENAPVVEREDSFTQRALLDRAADYFRVTRKPPEERRIVADLEPQLAEFDLRCMAGDYNKAAEVLSEIDFDCLLTWGYYELAIACNRQLEGRVTDQRLRQESAGNLGLAFYSTGQMHAAIARFEQALASARETSDLRGEERWLGNLALVYSDLGQTDRAIEFRERALAIDREVGSLVDESVDLENLGLLFIDANMIHKAVETYGEAIALADSINFPQTQSYARWGLALAHLHVANVESARSAVESARRYDVPENNHNVFALLGIISLRQLDLRAAQDAFATAIAHADMMSLRTLQNFDALDARGVALCGLHLCRGEAFGNAQSVSNTSDAAPSTLANTQNPADASPLLDAIATFRAARGINRDAGIVARVVWLLDALALARPGGAEWLAEARKAASGDQQGTATNDTGEPQR